MSTTATIPRAPITLEEFARLKETALFTDDDVAALRESRPILSGQADAILDVWYGFIGSKPFLLDFFRRERGAQPDTHYLTAVRERFGQWILDTAAANYDQEWLDYQFEIGRRHHRTGKNRTDHADAVDNISFRYLFPVAYPIVATLKPFLAKTGAAAERVEAMHQAWLKSVLLQLTLWSYPYVKDGDY
jgi:hypothetical protein